MGLASLIGPIMFTQIFAVSISTRADWGLPGAPFLLASALVIGAVFLGWRTTAPTHAE